MNIQLDWGKLYKLGDCKAIGIPWTKEEADAHYHLKIPAEYVRQGILTAGAWEEQKVKDEALMAKGEIPLVQRSQDELVNLAKEKGFAVASSTPHDDLVRLINSAPEKKEVKKEPEEEPTPTEVKGYERKTKKTRK
ncbi:MAG: hypothetical protein ACOZAL_01085 [Patescibacteria group bacterium]